MQAVASERSQCSAALPHWNPGKMGGIQGLGRTETLCKKASRVPYLAVPNRGPHVCLAPAVIVLKFPIGSCSLLVSVSVPFLAFSNTVPYRTVP